MHLSRARWLERIWAHSVLPYIEDQFFDEPDRVDEFTLAAVEQRVNRPATDAPEPSSVARAHLGTFGSSLYRGSVLRRARSGRRVHARCGGTAREPSSDGCT